jgi:hypothetical protein
MSMAIRKGDEIEDFADLLEGRRVIKVERRIYDHGPADYPVLYLNDGSEVIILDGWGFPPIIELEREPHKDPILWEGD